MQIVSALAEPKIYYKFDLEYKSGNISIKSFNIEFYNEEMSNNFGLYSAVLFDSNKNVTKVINFQVPNKGLVDSSNNDHNGFTSGGEVLLNEVSFELYVPYSENVNEIIILNPDMKELAKKDVSMYSKNPAVNIVNNSEGDKEGLNSNNSQKTDLSKNYWWIALVIVLIIILTAIYYWNWRKNKK